MKKKIFAALICASMIGCLAATPVLADETVKADGDYKIAVITMDSVDQHWVSLKEGAEEEAKADDVTVDFMAPDVKDDAKQIECINNAVAGGYDALMVAANSEDAVSGTLQEAIDAGMKLVYVDSPANVEAEATSTGVGNAIKASGSDEIIGVGFDKSDTLKGLIEDGYLVCTMAQNPDQMGKLGVQACIKALNGEDLGGEVTDTGVSVLTKESLAEDGAEETEEAADADDAAEETEEAAE